MKRFRSTLWILAAITCGSVYAAWSVWQGQLGTSLADEIAAAKREGVPVDPSDLAEPEIPEAENAARPYLTAVAHTKTVMDHTMWSKKLQAAKPYKRTIASLNPAERRRLKALVTTLQPAIDALGRAGQRPKMNLYRRHVTDESMEDVRWFKQLIRSITFKAEVEAIDGDWRSSLSDLEVAARASALFARSPTFYEGLIRSLAEREIFESLGRIAAKHSREPEFPARVLRVVDAFGPPPDPRRMLADFAWSGRQMIDFFAAGGDSCTPGDPLLKLRSIREANEAQHIAHARQIYRTIPKDPYDFEGLRRCLQAADARTQEGGRLRTLVPVGETESAANILATNEARRRVARAAVGVLNAWRSLGRLPKALPDPFGDRLHYRRMGNECAVYSVGEDRKDNGGTLREKSNPGDIVWRFPLPKRDPATIRVATR